MKIIDEKGRLFGKINVIDFLAIFFLFSLLPMFYFSYKLTQEKPKIIAQIQALAPLPAGPPKEFIEMEVSCLLVRLNPEIASIISVGDKELEGNSDTLGEIISIGKFSPYVYQLDIGLSPRKLEKVAPTSKQVPATLKIKAEVRGNNLYYKDSQILNNRVFEFKTDKYHIEAIPTFASDLGDDLEERMNHIEYMVGLLEPAIETIKNKVLDMQAQINNLSSMKVEK